MKSWSALLFFAAASCLAGAAPLPGSGACHGLQDASDAGEGSYERREFEWSAELLAQASSLPVQDGGRIKPLSTYAAFTLLRFNGKRSVALQELDTGEMILVRMHLKDVGKHKITPMEWLLDCLFFPEMAHRYEAFLIEDWAVATELGIETEGKRKRDRYSYEELKPALTKLNELTRRYHQIAEDDRDIGEQQIVRLGENVFTYELLVGFFDFAREGASLPEGAGLQRVFGAEEELRLSAILERYTEIVEHAEAVNAEHLESGAEEYSEAHLREQEALGVLDQQVMAAGFSDSLSLIPPVDGDDDEWLTPWELVRRTQARGAAPPPEQIASLAQLEDLFDARDDAELLQSRFSGFHASVVEEAEARELYWKVPLEVSFYRAQWLFWSQVLFVLSFVVVALSWLWPGARKLIAGSVGLISLATVLLTVGIVLRCVIRSRPPVSTLYETILFCTACGVIVAMFIEWVNRRRVGLAMAALVGAGGMFFAHRYEMMDKQDTMPSLVAVLDTNFWLSTHVTTVTLGYAAGLLAGLIAHVYVFGKLLGFRKGDARFYRDTARMVYGVICFGLLFSTVGTILGGVWANDSWGRFWGWDPKENGALLIVIWELAILHGRMGGYIRDHGLCVAAIFGTTVVSFSWWHVNHLGVGLHAYGKTGAIIDNLWFFYRLEWAIVLLGVLAWYLARRRPGAPPPPTSPPDGAVPPPGSAPPPAVTGA